MPLLVDEHRAHHHEVVTLPQPAIDLTPQVRHTLAGLRAPRHGRRGVNRSMTSPLGQWVQPLDCDRLAAHLGIALPSFPHFVQLGYRTTCASDEGEDLFTHPVTSTSQLSPLPSDPGVDGHSALIVHTPPGVDPWSVALQDYLSEDVCWMSIGYGLPRRPPSPDGGNALRPSPHRTRISFSDGTALEVKYAPGPQTLLSWRAEVDDASFSIGAALPLEPLAAVQVLATARHVPFQVS
jgi:hypothetical protein